MKWMHIWANVANGLSSLLLRYLVNSLTAIENIYVPVDYTTIFYSIRTSFLKIISSTLL